MNTQTHHPLLDTLDAWSPAGNEPDWLAELRRDAAYSFVALGLPTIKHEEWRWTNLKALNTDFTPAPAAEVTEADLASYLIPEADDIRLVFVNGHLADKLTRLPRVPKDLVIEPLSRVLATSERLDLKLSRHTPQAEAFTALNTAMFTDGAYIRVGNALNFETPIHILYVSTETASPVVSTPRSLILAGENATFRVIESYVGLGNSPRFVNALTELALKPGAQVRHVKLLRETDATVHIGRHEFHVERDAQLTSHNINLSAKLARNATHAVLASEGAFCNLNGLVLGNGSQHFDHHVEVDHVRPHGRSNQLYRSVVDDKSRSVFSGKIVVRPGANGTDAQQQNNNLLLSDDAKVDTKPQLEIYTDDVKCSHGATSGRLDEESIFFLRARGLDEKAARGLLTFAFANDVIEQIKIDPVREHLEAIMRERLHGLLES